MTNRRLAATHRNMANRVPDREVAVRFEPRFLAGTVSAQVMRPTAMHPIGHIGLASSRRPRTTSKRAHGQR